MASCSISSIKDLNAAIAAQNPFPYPASVSDREIWRDDLPNLNSLNDRIRQVVFQALERSRQGRSALSAIAVTGNPGMGKSHLISTLRHQIQQDDSALLVYINAGQLTDLNLLRYQFHQRVVESLRYAGQGGVMQWQSLAAAIANHAIHAIDPKARTFSPPELIAKLNNHTRAKNQTWVTQLTEGFCKLKPDIADPDIVRGIIWTLSSTEAPYSIKWLSGMAIAPSKATELGLPNRSRDSRDADAWEILMHTLTLISFYYPLIICFDELEAADKSDTGLKRERVVASIIKRIWDTLPRASLERGMVLFSVMTEETWRTKVQALPPGIANYLSKQGEPMQLYQISPDGIVELVRLWLQGFYDHYHLTPPNPVYPFEAGQLRALAREQLSVREILEWCAENFHPVEEDPFEQVEAAFEREQSFPQNRESVLDNGAVAQAIYFGLQRVLGQTIAGVEVESVSDRIQRDRQNRGYIQLTLTTRENGRLSTLGVAILQEMQSKKVEAALKRLVQYETFDLTCGCLIRAYENGIPPHWQASRYLQQFTGERGGQWVDLKAQEILPLIAVWRVYQRRIEYGLRTEQIFEFIAYRKLATENPLLQAIARSTLSRERVKGAKVTPESESVKGINLATSTDRLGG
ncbi:ATP-binding protein [Laspinema olomoucense]|uniref:ATP-binding protein n=1 Tax=Laspinema olomoucense TaxID=3231600 RepID=UPI0021BB28B5|nr:ATP-binding protein [Laspinema sp. D3d]MCT7974244.1 ATP-binding protein [Laspinema sp. D3d]